MMIMKVIKFMDKQKLPILAIKESFKIRLKTQTF